MLALYQRRRVWLLWAAPALCMGALGVTHYSGRRAMDVLVFPSPEALEVALRSALIPREVQAKPARAALLESGEVELVPSVPMPITPELRRAGITTRASTIEPREVGCWAEALPVTRAPLPEGPLEVALFTVGGERSLLELTGELLRLGCDRQELSLIASDDVHAVVRVTDPPWFVVSRALDHLDDVRVFRPVTPGNDRVWIELGATHPLSATLEAPDTGLVLLTVEARWWRLREGEWHDVDRLLVPAGELATETLAPARSLPAISVVLSLARAGRPELPTLFVVPDGQREVEALVRSTPEHQLEDVLFAVSGSLVLLRARPGREASAGALPGEPYARLQELPNLFVPADTTVEPPLRRDRLRTWLAPEPETLVWLQSGPTGLVARSLPDRAFRPLTEWVDYVIDRAPEPLLAWARSATFDFEPFVATDDALPARPSTKGSGAAGSTAKTDAETDPSRDATSRDATSSDESKRSARPRRESRALPPVPKEQPDAPPVVVDLPQSPSEAEAIVAREEAAFLELEAPAESPVRRTAWVRLAELYGRVQRGRDAGMAWAHALWEADGDEAARLARRWADTSGVRLDSALSLNSPNPEQTRGAVAQLVAASFEKNSAVASQAAEWSAFLERSGEDLDIRSYWLGRAALARLASGDALGLARARDRVLARVQAGLSLDRDVPRLLRVMGRGNAGGAGSGRAMRVIGQLEALLKAFEETPRKRSAVEAPPQFTQAYVSFEFAWAFARLAHAERARALRDKALTVLDKKDPIHQYLTRAYAARIEQALEGIAPSTPLSPEINGLLTDLEVFDRYKVDRLRQFSQVLEPQERLQAAQSFNRAKQSGRGEDLGTLRSLREPGELLKAIDSRAGAAGDEKLPVEERVRLIDGLLDYLPRLPESQALPLLQRFLSYQEGMPARHRGVVLEDALKVAGHFGRTSLVKQLVLQLGSAIKEVGAEGIGELGGLLVSGVRSLRRVGLRDEANELLARASTVLKGDDLQTLQARLGLASGFMYLGSYTKAQPIVDEAVARLSRESSEVPIIERMRLNRAAAQALSHASTEVALPGLLRLSQQLPFITDSFNTNGTTGADGKPRHHFCLALVDFADSMVLGHVGDDLTLNETTRRFLDEDEYLVRRRVHRDVGGE